MQGRITRTGLIILAGALACPAEAELRGTTRPARDVSLRAPVDARIAEVPVAESQAVDAGAVLVRLDDAVQRLRASIARQRAEATGRLEELRVAHRLETGKAARVRESFDTGAAQEWEVLEADARRDAAAARLTAAEEEQHQAAAEHALEAAVLERYTVAAPFDGTVVTVDAEAGDHATRDAVLLRLVQTDPLELVVYFPAGAYGTLRAGETVLAVAPDGSTAEATIAAIDPVIDAGSDSFRVVFTLPNPDGRLPAGVPMTLGDAEVERLTAVD